MTPVIACRHVLTYQLGRLAAGHRPMIRVEMGFTLQNKLKSMTGENILNFWAPSPRMCFYKIKKKTDLAAVRLK